MSSLIVDHLAPRSDGLRPSRRTVCAVLHTLTVGGAEVLAARIARRLNDRYRFVFACLDGEGLLGQELRRDGFEVHQLDRRPGIDLRCVRRLAQLARHHKVDVFHAHQYTPFFYASLARGWRSLPVIFTEHGRHFPDLPSRKRMVANRFLLKRRDRAIGVGRNVRMALINNEGLPSERVRVIYNGIDCKQYAQPAERLAARRELSLDSTRFVIVQVARLDPLKDHLTALRMVRRLSDAGKNICLLIVGDGPERAKIEAEISRLGLWAHVRLTGLRRDVPRLLAAADLSLLTSLSEGIPLAIIEAMSAGVAVISTDVGGVPEVVVDGQTALLAPAGDDKALAEKVSLLYGDRDLQQRFAREGQRRAYDLFSEDQMHAEYARLYQDLTANKRA